MSMGRRNFLKVLSLGAGSLAFLNNPAFARMGQTSGPSQNDRVLVIVFQRGGMDGLMAVPPMDDSYLPKWRPGLNMGKKHGLLDLDGRFGLHPAFGALHGMFKEKRLAVIHGVGLTHTARSHFDAQDFMETGTPGRKGTPDGWLSRLGFELGDGRSPLRSVAFSASLPRAMTGASPAFALENLGQLARFQDAGLSQFAQTQSALLKQAAANAQALGEFRNRVWPATHKAAQYPRGDLGRSLKQAAQLIKAGVGVQLVMVNSEGWDTHRGQGVERGAFFRAAAPLGAALAAFQLDLGRHVDRVLTLTMTEFGRTVKENGTGGTDHGRASCFFAMGAGVKGGRVYGSVPELKKSALADGRDLPVAVDFRSVLWEAATKHFNLNPGAGLFPGWRGPSLPFLEKV